MSEQSPRPSISALADPAATLALHPNLPHAPAAFRNREPILAALRTVLRSESPPVVLEIASGTGEHGLWFTQQWDGLVWQPTEASAHRLEGISAWRDLCPDLHERFLAPRALRTTERPWKKTAPYDTIYVANLTHISPWPATEGLVAGASEILSPGGRLLIYGPFRENGAPTSEGNVAFDRKLRDEDPSWGIRDAEAVEDLMATAGFLVEARHEMPANNRLLVGTLHE